MKITAETEEQYGEAFDLLIDEGEISTPRLQRAMRIGYGTAHRILDRMESDGMIGPPDGNKARKVILPPSE